VVLGAISNNRTGKILKQTKKNHFRAAKVTSTQKRVSNKKK
jgi:hypothetical protein